MLPVARRGKTGTCGTELIGHATGQRVTQAGGRQLV